MAQTLALELTLRSLNFTVFAAEIFTCHKKEGAQVDEILTMAQFHRVWQPQHAQNQSPETSSPH